jgi:Putative Flp pilus-assembly TadE/G-like
MIWTVVLIGPLNVLAYSSPHALGAIMIYLVKRFLKDKSGNFALTFGLTIFPVLFLAGVASDYSNIQRERWRLQETADSSALYAVQELQNAGTTETDLSKTGQDVVEANFMIEGELEFDLDTVTNRLSVSLDKDYEPTFLKLINPAPIPIGVVAEVIYSETFDEAKCFVSLSPTGAGVLNLNGTSDVKAVGCGVHVNSDSSSAVDLNGAGTSINSANNCFVGGVGSGSNRIFPPPSSDCAVLPDPFDDLALPTVGACNQNSFKVGANKSVTLSPGVYCNGLTISSGANVTLSPGLYIIKNGSMKTSGSAKITGNGVTLLFTGTNAQFDLSGGTTLNLKAMKTGALAGFVLYFDPAATLGGTNSFGGNSNTYVEGIMYFGKASISVNGNASVNGSSPFFALFAHTVTLSGTVEWNFKVDEAATDIPVPEQLYTKTISAYLVK